MRFHNRLSKSQKLTNLWQRGHLNLNGSLCANTRPGMVPQREIAAFWAHWEPQCVEGSGDWMARGMYQEGSHAYKHHVANYGHPSEVGFKDILPLFKAEQWNPDSLVAIYKSIGAQYFLCWANHHDNFDLWDSKYQPWNSVNIHPKRDIPRRMGCGSPQAWSSLSGSAPARRPCPTWYEPSRRYDRNGTRWESPYDGGPDHCRRQRKMVGRNGSSATLCAEPPLSAKAAGQTAWSENNGDGETARHSRLKNSCTNFYNRTLDVINRYNPDLLYFDTTGVPFYPKAMPDSKIAAHFYNHNMQTHGGKNEAVIVRQDSYRSAERGIGMGC